MRRPDHPEVMYLDFDKFFASVMQAKYPALRGKPVGVLPFENSRTILISCSKEAKRRGVGSLMAVADAKRLCPDIILICQEPDLYASAHKFLLSEIEMVVPIDAVKSIDEICAKLDPIQARQPERIGRAIKERLLKEVGPSLTCSIGFAANRLLAKMAVEQNKPDGITIWHPSTFPQSVMNYPLKEVPGIGRRMVERLNLARLWDVADLMNADPKQVRMIWKSVAGERMWYALHGYEIEAQPTTPSQFGHGKRMPAWALPEVRQIARELTMKAARRMRRNGYSASLFRLYVGGETVRFARAIRLPEVCDDAAILHAFATVWTQAELHIPRHIKLFDLDVSLSELSLTAHRQLDMLLGDEDARRKHEALSTAKDQLNTRYSETVLSNGIWDKRGDYAGAKISYARIPDPEDFF